MAELLEVSRSGVYNFFHSIGMEYAKYPQELLDEVCKIWKENKRIYGLRRILEKIKEIDPSIGARKLRNMMNILEIKGIQEKKFKVRTTDSNHNNRIAPDLVQRNFTVEKPNRVWVSDVTYLRTAKGWIYLCVILDLYSRKVIGWKISEKNDSRLITSCIGQTISERNPGRGLMFHSDRGSNYTSRETRIMLANNIIRRSNSRKGNCWDNAVAESFFSTLKREMESIIFLNKEDAIECIFDYIEVFYNRQRIHSKLGYISPVKFEEIAA
jgi:putative transposase